MAKKLLTEFDWFAAVTPWPLLDYLESRASVRKLRLFAVAACRCMWDDFSDGDRKPLEMMERLADGMATKEDVQQSASSLPWWDNTGEYWGMIERIVGGIVDPDDSPMKCARAGLFWLRIWLTNVSGENMCTTDTPAKRERIRQEQRRQAILVREVFGNPYRHETCPPTWLTWNQGAVPSLAQNIYDHHHFDQMPILADALEDAGCSWPSILSHARNGGPHYRGCWLVDLLLGKK